MMRKLLVIGAIAVFSLNSMVLARGLPEEMPLAPAAVSTSDTGIYGGIEGGWGLTNWKDIGYKGYTIAKDNGFVSRVFAGFDINRYLAIEAGYSYFFNQPNFTIVAANNTVVNKVKRTHCVDLMGKFKIPSVVIEGLDLYGKFGVNYLTTQFNSEWTPTMPDGYMYYMGKDKKNSFNIAYGVGVDYYITPNIIANIEWLRFNGHSKVDLYNSDFVQGFSDKYQPHTDAFMLGLRYKFLI